VPPASSHAELIQQLRTNNTDDEYEGIDKLMARAADAIEAMAALASNAAEPAGGEARALTGQQVYDRFSFLEGAVGERTYKRIAETAIEIQRLALATPPQAPAAPAGLSDAQIDGVVDAVKKVYGGMAGSSNKADWERIVAAGRCGVRTALAASAPGARGEKL